jgi:hypothetical protein
LCPQPAPGQHTGKHDEKSRKDAHMDENKHWSRTKKKIPPWKWGNFVTLKTTNMKN